MNHDRPSKEKEASKPSKALMTEHEGLDLILYYYHQKGDQSIIHSSIYCI